MPGMPPIPGLSLLSGSGIVATTASVVKNIAATRHVVKLNVTLVGSTIPSSSMFTHSFVDVKSNTCICMF